MHICTCARAPPASVAVDRQDCYISVSVAHAVAHAYPKLGSGVLSRVHSTRGMFCNVVSLSRTQPGQRLADVCIATSKRHTVCDQLHPRLWRGQLAQRRTQQRKACALTRPLSSRSAFFIHQQHESSYRHCASRIRGNHLLVAHPASQNMTAQHEGGLDGSRQVRSDRPGTNSACSRTICKAGIVLCFTYCCAEQWRACCEHRTRFYSVGPTDPASHCVAASSSSSAKLGAKELEHRLKLIMWARWSSESCTTAGLEAVHLQHCRARTHELVAGPEQ